MNTLNSTDRFAARLMMVSFFLPDRWQVQATGAVSLYFVFRGLLTKQAVSKGNYLWALFLGSGFLLYLLAVPITPPEYKKALWHICEHEVSLLLMPLVFGIISPYFRELVFGERIYFVYACLISCMAGNAHFAYHYFFADHGLYALSHVRYRIIFETFTGIHPTYMSMYLCCSVCILLLYDGFNTRRQVIAKYALLYVLLVLLLSLLAKSPLIALALIFLHYACLRPKALYKYKLLISGMVAGVVATCLFIPFFRQRFMEVVQFFGIGKPGSSAVNSFYDRTMIWNTDVSMLRHYWLTGVGPGRLLHMLHERYFFYSLANQSPVAYFDPHNQYLEVWLSFGIVGIAVFISILAAHYLMAIKHKDYLYLYLLLILTVTFFTETVFYRQKGVLFFAVLTSLFFFRNIRKRAV